MTKVFGNMVKLKLFLFAPFIVVVIVVGFLISFINMVLVNCWWFTPLPVHFADIWGNNIRGSTASIKILFQHDGILIQALISWWTDTNLYIS